jgi:hypothetical protein
VSGDPNPFAGLDDAIRTGSTDIGQLGEVIGLRGWLKRRATINRNNNMPLLMVNSQYGTNFQRYRDAIAFMDGQVGNAKQRARDRAAALRVMA